MIYLRLGGTEGRLDDNDGLELGGAGDGVPCFSFVDVVGVFCDVS